MNDRGAARAAEAWLAPRRAATPEAFLPFVDDALAGGGEGAPPDVVAALAARGVRALGVALHPEGRPRRGAFDLLAADAWITWACEAAAETEDPEGALERVLDAVRGAS